MRWVCIYFFAVTCAVAQEAPPGVPAEAAWRDYGKK